jgi:hypothetical protein
MEIQRYNRQINNIGSATRCERRDGSEFLVILTMNGNDKKKYG